MSSELETDWELIKSINKFSLDVYGLLFKNVNKNLVFSPVSLFHLMSLFTSCSNEQTRSDLAKTLRLSDGSITSPYECVLTLFETVFDRKHHSVCTETSALSERNLLAKKYAQIIERRSEKCAIKSRIEIDPNKLEQKLSQLGMNSTRDECLVFENRFDFQFEWKEPFTKNNKRIFTKVNNKRIEIELMTLPKQRFLYAKNPLNLPLKICEFPFRDECHSFMIILPDNGCLAQIEAQLNTKLLDELISQLDYVEVNSVMPKFKIDDEFNVRELLQQLGAGCLFDFSERKSGLCAVRACYQSKLSVQADGVCSRTDNTFVFSQSDEQATNRSDDNHPCEDFTCDNPFIFVIRNRKFNLIMCIGKLLIPDSNF